jgi:ADP-ribosylglycohydrolase
MRVCPIPIAYASLGETYIREAANLASSLTHGFYSSGLTSEFAVLVHRALNGYGRESLTTPLVEVSETMANNGGYAPHSLSSALFHFHSTGSFEEAILQAVNFGNDADTIGAITGQLAGAFYGFSSIPKEWVDGLYDLPLLVDKAKGLMGLNT